MWGVFVSWMNVTANQLRMSGGGATPFENAKSIIFDGVDDYISTGYSFDATVTPNFSMSFWIKSTSNGSFIHPIGIKTDGGKQESSPIMMHSKKLLIQDKNGWNWGSSIINDGNWHNIIMTASYNGNATLGTTLNIYLDGNLTPDLYSATMDTNSNNYYLSGDLFIGNFNGTGYHFPGNIDEVAVWESILSSADITSIYNSGVPNDLSSLNPIGYWRNGDGDTYDIITDHGSGGNDGTMTNMTSGDIVTDVP